MGNDIEYSYQIAVQMLNTENNMVWNRYNVFLVANSIIISTIGIIAAFGDNTNSLPWTIYLFPVLAISVMIICLFWGILSLYGFYVCSGYTSIVRAIEKDRKWKIVAYKGRPTSGRKPPIIALLTIFLFLLIYCFIWTIPNSESLANIAKKLTALTPVVIPVLFMLILICWAIYLNCEKKRFNDAFKKKLEDKSNSQPEVRKSDDGRTHQFT